MGRPVQKRQKRQKLDHVSDEEASFASFDEISDNEVFSEAESLHSSNESVPDTTEDVVAAIANKSKEHGQNGTANQPRKIKKNALRSSVDMNNIAISAGSFKSNMFKLQIDELLNRIRTKRGKQHETAEDALFSVKKTIEQMQSRDALPINDAERHLLQTRKVAIPFPNPRPPKDARYKLEFAKPTNINVAGSYAIKTTTKSERPLEIDMSLTMPASLFQDKDFLNYRYFYKRAYYLACVAADLKQAHSANFAINYEYFRDDPLKPVLVVSPKKADKSTQPSAQNRWRINILLCISEDLFLPTKLLLSKNCVRTGTDDEKTTPFYNSSLRADMLLGSYLKLLHGTANSCAAFRDAAMLGTVWLRQRGFDSSLVKGGFGTFEWVATIAVMLSGDCSDGKPILSPGYSSYQLFKATLQYIAMKDLSKMSNKTGGVQAPGDGTPLLWDELRSHNVLYKVSPWAYKSLRNEAKITLSMLGDQLFDGFRATFIQRVDLLSLRYDYTLQIPVSAVSENMQPDAQLLMQHCRSAYDVLRKGLGDRVTLMDMKLPHVGSWPTGSTRTHVSTEDSIFIGLIVNPETVNRTVDHGPPAENKAEAAAFRDFWGEKAELRRFRDGSILESLVWTQNADGQSVLEQIVRYLATRSFGKKAEETLTFHADALSRLVGNANAAVAFQPAVDAFKRLENDIRGLESLPLSIRHLMPSDAQLRSTSIVVPAASFRKRRPQPADVVLQFEGSARWPDELVAIQRTKIAFLLNLSEAIMENVEGANSRIGLENEDHQVLNQGFLIINYDSGASFRLRIYHDREQTLLERQLKDKTSAPDVREAAAIGLAMYKRNYLRRPVHTQSIIRLCSRFPALSGTIRLLKKWFASHLLMNHFSEELIELFAVQTFLQPWPFSAPSSIQSGFLRTLHWLSRWDWKDEPLIVDLSGVGDLKQPEWQSIKTRFEAWRKLDPSMSRVALFAASHVDPEGNTWTDGQPAKVVVGRAMALAKAACVEAETNYLSLQPSSLFSSSLADFDFVLHLDAGILGHISKPAARAFKNLEIASLDDESLIGLDIAAEYLEELQTVYGSAVVFFSGGHERPVIAGLWSPLTARRGFKVNLAYSTIPQKPTSGDEDIQVEANRSAMLAEISRLGGNLVVKVEINKH